MEGARQVNLEPSDRPQDVYTGVAELVRAQVEIDAAAGDPTAQMLRGHITRKVVKQSVMTNVYGVTFIGARAQIQKQLEDNPAIPRAEALFCAGYLARLVFGSIKTVFTGATKIQHWLALTARMISRSVSPLQYASLGDHETKLRESENKHIRRKGMVEFMTSVVWTTPLRMAVVQPYRQENSVVVQTNLQKIYISDPAVIDQVNSQKQMTAFPPNFIHSLDATHMLLSATKCAEKGITFAAVHDSFWTHPADIDRLNTILREAFIELHTVDIMEKLKEEFETRYRGYKYLVTIPAGTVAARKIRMARKVRAASVHKKLGLTVVEDLQWELERDQLLASDDPEERKRGAEMLTPSEILRQAGGVTAIETMESIGPELGGVDAGQPDDKEGAEASDIFSDDDTVSDVHEEPDDEDVVVQDAVQEHMEMDSDEAEAAAEAAEESEDAAASVKKAIKKKMYPTVPVWMPLDFPPLPPKGGFDVSRLKESQYFFS